MAVSGEILAGLLGFSLVEKAGDTLDKIFESVFGGESFKDILRDAADRFSAATGKIPPNHDLERTIRACELLATRTLLTRYAQEKERERLARGGIWNEPFVAAAQNWLSEQIGLLPGASPKPDHELIAELEARLDEALSARTLAELRAALAEPQRRVWRELTHGAAGRDAWRAPDDLEAMFLGDGGEKRPGWALVFVALMREALKSNHKAEVAFLAARLAALRPLQERMAEKLDRIETKVDALPDAVVEKLLAALDARGETRKAESAGLERRTLFALAQRLRPEETLDLERAIVELEKAVEIALEAIARGQRGTNEGEFVDHVLSRLAELTKQGAFDEGAREVDAALAELDRRRAEQEEAFRRQRRALLEAGVEQDSLRRDAAAVARRLEVIAAQEHPGERPAWTKTFRESWDRYYEEGLQKGVNFSLEIAIALARRMVEGARDGKQKGDAKNLLGSALGVLGERETGTGTLSNAAAVFRGALKEYSREIAPLDWAGTQNNLGNTLRVLGERETETRSLKEAVDAFREALKERTRERSIVDWAVTLNNLGAALSSLGDCEGDEKLLRDAIAVFRDVLQQLDPKCFQLLWARTQINLGNALQILGERIAVSEHLQDAVAAYRQALTQCTRERNPLDWAMTQNNLGNALGILGEQENDAQRFDESAIAFRAALQEWTRERIPSAWAMTQSNLGNALLRFGEREGRTERLEEAVAAYSEALKERTRERVPFAWATTQNNLGAALRALGERESGTGRLEEAVAAFSAALTVYTREASPYYFEGTQRNLSRALALLEERRKAGRG
jgi:tetratricopeptide (TPR) repeat protein